MRSSPGPISANSLIFASRLASSNFTVVLAGWPLQDSLGPMMSPQPSGRRSRLIVSGIVKSVRSFISTPSIDAMSVEREDASNRVPIPYGK